MNFLKKTKLFWLSISLILIFLTMRSIHLPSILDSLFYYTTEYANLFFKNLNAVDRKKYLFHEIIDIFLIFNYSLLIYYFSNVISKFNKIFLLPGFFDFIETITIILLLCNIIESAPIWLGLVTSFKWLTLIVIIFWFLKDLFIQYVKYKK